MHAPRPGRPAATRTRFGTLVLVGFILSLLVPIQLYLGDLRLSAYRIILLLVIVPAAVHFLTAPHRRLRLADLLMVLYALVGAVSLMVTGSGIATCGVFVVDSLGPYLVARAYLTTLDDMITVARTFFFAIAFTVPFAAYEALTTDPIILTVLDTVFDVLPNVPHEIRLGMDRAQVVFDHPILYGLFCSMGFSLSVMVAGLRRSLRLDVFKGVVVGLATFLSLSSGAFLASGFQVLLIAFDRAFSWLSIRWTLLLGGTAVMLAVVEAASNRTLAQISIGFLALNPGTAWTRLTVNEAALDELSRHYWFGLGMEPNWNPPYWVVTKSIDNFYIATAFRHGMPTAVLLMLAIAAMVIALLRAGAVSPEVGRCRSALLFTLSAVLLSVLTVHMWNTTYVAFIFLIGSGLWIADTGREAGSREGRRTGSKEGRKAGSKGRRWPGSGGAPEGEAEERSDVATSGLQSGGRWRSPAAPE